MPDNNDFNSQDEKEQEQEEQDENSEIKKQVREELQDFLKQVEEETGEKIDIEGIKIEEVSKKQFFKRWFTKTLIGTISIFLTLFGFTSLLNVFTIDNKLFYFIYLMIPTFTYFLCSLLLFFLRKEFLFIFYGVILNTILLAIIIASAFFIPHIRLNSLPAILLVAIVCAIARTLIERYIKRFL